MPINAWKTSLITDPRRGRARCQALLAATEAVIWTSDPQGHFVERQPSWQAYTGQDWDQCRDLGWLQAVHEDDRAALLNAWKEASAQGKLYLATFRIWHEPQGYRTVAARAAPVRDADEVIVEWVGTLTDIHDRHLSVDELHRLNDTLAQQLEQQARETQRLFELSVDAMLSVSAEGRILAASPSLEEITGVPAAEALGRHYGEFVAAEDVARVGAEIGAVMAGRRAIDFETRIQHRNGSERIVSWRAVGKPDEARIYAIGRDVTEAKAEAALNVRAQRLQAVGQLTGGIAHDFNNLLAAIMGYLEVALRLSRDEKIVRMMRLALDAGRRGAKLVEQLLSFARKQELSLQPVNLNQLLQGMLPIIGQAMRGKARIALELDESIASAQADPTQMEMVVLNLCINARDAMPEGGGTITLRSWAHEIDGRPETRVEDLPAGRYSCVSVIDTGTGMDEATLARCLEPFFTTKPEGRGTGLGLAQALGVIQQCGGALVVDSKPGEGTRIAVVLPVAQEAAAEAVPPTLQVPAVMVVDDDPDVLHATGILIEALGYAPIPAPDPKAAITLLASGHPIEVILADFNMPGMDGAELLKQAFQLRPKLAGILMTGYTPPRGIAQMLPGVPVLRKPLQPAKLASLLAQCVSEHRRWTGEIEGE